MSLLYESIKVENRQLVSISFHNERINRSRKELFGTTEEINLVNKIVIPEELSGGIYKCRVFYNQEIESAEFIKYQQRNIKQLYAVVDDIIGYSYKYTDRSAINKLKEKHAPSEEEDIIIIKNGMITDTSYSNVALYDGEKWFTPAEPLLKGTQRARLLKEGKIFERKIKLSDLTNYVEIKLINALMDFDTSPTLKVETIKIL